MGHAYCKRTQVRYPVDLSRPVHVLHCCRYVTADAATLCTSAQLPLCRGCSQVACTACAGMVCGSPTHTVYVVLGSLGTAVYMVPTHSLRLPSRRTARQYTVLCCAVRALLTALTHSLTHSRAQRTAGWSSRDHRPDDWIALRCVPVACRSDFHSLLAAASGGCTLQACTPIRTTWSVWDGCGILFAASLLPFLCRERWTRPFTTFLWGFAV
jgi:hypothetical protein